MRFGRERIDKSQKLGLEPCFAIENYLDYQGETFSTKYDPNSLLYLSKVCFIFNRKVKKISNFYFIFSKAMDLFDISDGYLDLNEALSNIKCPVMIMGAQTDILFPVKQQRDLANWLKKSGNSAITYFEMDSLYGSNSFFLINLKNNLNYDFLKGMIHFC